MRIREIFEVPIVLPFIGIGIGAAIVELLTKLGVTVPPQVIAIIVIIGGAAGVCGGIILHEKHEKRSGK